MPEACVGPQEALGMISDVSEFVSGVLGHVLSFCEQLSTFTGVLVQAAITSVSSTFDSAIVL